MLLGGQPSGAEGEGRRSDCSRPADPASPCQVSLAFVLSCAVRLLRTFGVAVGASQGHRFLRLDDLLILSLGPHYTVGAIRIAFIEITIGDDRPTLRYRSAPKAVCQHRFAEQPASGAYTVTPSRSASSRRQCSGSGRATRCIRLESTVSIDSTTRGAVRSRLGGGKLLPLPGNRRARLRRKRRS